MARVELLITIDKIVSSNLQPVASATALVKLRSTGNPVTVYAGEVGGATVSNPLVSDTNGRINGWVEEASLILTISGAGITSYNQPYEAVRGDGTANIADGIVTETKLAVAVQESIFEVGDLKPSARSSVPSGWLLCDGAAVSRATYSALFAAIGTLYGAGDTSTTFNLPDLRGRTAVGVDGSAARLDALDSLGDAGGVQKHSLTPAETAVKGHAHGHTITVNSGGTHDHDLHTQGVLITFGGPNGYSGNFTKNSGTSVGRTNDGGTHTHTVSGGVTSLADGASGSAHQNMPPYLTVNWFVRAF